MCMQAQPFHVLQLLASQVMVCMAGLQAGMTLQTVIKSLLKLRVVNCRARVPLHAL